MEASACKERCHSVEEEKRYSLEAARKDKEITVEVINKNHSQERLKLEDRINGLSHVLHHKEHTIMDISSKLTLTEVEKAKI